MHTAVLYLNYKRHYPLSLVILVYSIVAAITAATLAANREVDLLENLSE